jgi:RNA recognition motif-containing protein
MNIYIANLSFDLREEDLKKYFAPYGEVASVKIIMDKMTERSRGFGFVEMTDDTAAGKAIAELNGSMVDGRPIKVSEAKAKPGKDSSGPSERNYNNSNSYNQTRY